MNGSLCDAIISENARLPGKNSQKILEDLELRGLFVMPLDNEHRWYRYHRLFAELLRKQLTYSFTDQEPSLHRSASLWFEANGYITQAIDQSLAAEDMNRAITLVEKNSPSFILNGDVLTVKSWLSAFPSGVINSRPRLCIAVIWTQLLTSQLYDIPMLLLRTRDLLSTLESLQDIREIHEELTTLQAFLSIQRHDSASALKILNEAMQNAPPKQSHIYYIDIYLMAYAYLETGKIEEARKAFEEANTFLHTLGEGFSLSIFRNEFISNLAMKLRNGGKLHQGQVILQQHLQSAIRQGLAKSPSTIWLYDAMGKICLEQNDLNQAEIYFQKGLDIDSSGITLSSFDCFFNLCRVKNRPAGDEQGVARDFQKERFDSSKRR